MKNVKVEKNIPKGDSQVHILSGRGICPYFKNNRCVSPLAGNISVISVCENGGYTACLIFKETVKRKQEYCHEVP